MDLDHAEMRRRLAAARVGHLATTTPAGHPHVVVCCFALDPDGGDTLWTVVDGKPKSTTRLQRLRNIDADRRASVLVDHYDDADWSRLWWVRVDGLATVTTTTATTAAALTAKYPQYAADPPTGPVIALRIRRWTGWQAGPDDGGGKNNPKNL